MTTTYSGEDLGNDLMHSLERSARNHKEHRRKVEEFLKTQPESTACPHHAEVTLPRLPADQHSRCKVLYGLCPMCRDEAARLRENRRLHAAGVPSNLLHCTLDNWFPRDPAEQENLAHVREFKKHRKGSVVLMGHPGTGKSHLAVGCMRAFQNPLMITNSELLMAQRATYRDDNATDPRHACRGADLLVLDEMGLSGGGKDESQLIYDILVFRYREYLPTILTSNLGFADLKGVFDPRLWDRLIESAKFLSFGGTSHRRGLREQYHQGEQCKAAPDESWKEWL